MMPESNPYTNVALRLAERLGQADRDAQKAQKQVIPFGMEKVTAKEEAERFRTMGREQKQTFITEHGIPDVIAMLKTHKSGTSSIYREKKP